MKQGQVVVDFLVTYGWAILVILIAIGALVYFGVLGPHPKQPEKTGLFDTKFGVLNCSDSYYVQDCGVFLSRCRNNDSTIDNSTHVCLVDVKIIK
jgi:hypothetical protein